jgi:hypothetical protein
MRPFFSKQSMVGYPIFAGVGASFGYWLSGVEERQACSRRDKGGLREKQLGSSSGMSPDGMFSANHPRELVHEYDHYTSIATFIFRGYMLRDYSCDDGHWGCLG